MHLLVLTVFLLVLFLVLSVISCDVSCICVNIIPCVGVGSCLFAASCVSGKVVENVKSFSAGSACSCCGFACRSCGETVTLVFSRLC